MMAAIEVSEIVNVLRRVAKGEVGVVLSDPDEPRPFLGNVAFLVDGWIITAHFKNGSDGYLRYIDSANAPDGREFEVEGEETGGFPDDLLHAEDYRLHHAMVKAFREAV